jgi:hypothetical protein
VVTLAELRGESTGAVNHKQVELSEEVMELARGIEPPTCGLQNRCSAIELRQLQEDWSGELRPAKSPPQKVATERQVMQCNS